jgi:hypothetical protein
VSQAARALRPGRGAAAEPRADDVLPRGPCPRRRAVILSLVLLDHATLSAELIWALRIGAPPLYTGGALASLVTLLTGIGLVR